MEKTFSVRFFYFCQTAHNSLKLERIRAAVAEKAQYNLKEIKEYFPVSDILQLEKLENDLESNSTFAKRIVSFYI
jgi:hypothetical protein